MNNSTADFINIDYLKQNYAGYLDSNIDANSLTSFIRIAQYVRIQEVLGYDLYQRYINNIISTGSPIGTKYIDLMDNHIMPATALYTIYEALLSLDTKVTNKGVVNQNSEWSQTADDKKMMRLQQQVLNNAEYYATRIREHITNDSGSFPEYFTTTGVNRVIRQNDNYNGSGLWLGYDPC